MGDRMSTNTAPPGWHPDPSNPGGAFRWWDGIAWTDHVQPAALPAPPPAWPTSSPAFTATYPMGTQGQSQVSFAKRNSLSLTAIAVVAAYIVLALTTRVVLLGIFPVLLSVRATKRKESLAPFAVGAAVVAIGVAFLALR